MKLKISRKISMVIAIETTLIIGLLLAFILIPGKKRTPKPQSVSVPKAEIATGRLIVYSPLRNAVITNGTLALNGKMKDFFEGTMMVRIKSSSGEVKMSEALTAQSDNYGKYALFQQGFSIPKTDKGSFIVEFVETSAKDGSETVLLAIPVIFK